MLRRKSGYDENKHSRDKRGRWAPLSFDEKVQSVIARMVGQGWSVAGWSRMAKHQTVIERSERGRAGAAIVRGTGPGGVGLVVHVDRDGRAYYSLLTIKRPLSGLVVRGIISTRTAMKMADAQERKLAAGHAALRARRQKRIAQLRQQLAQRNATQEQRDIWLMALQEELRLDRGVS